MRRIWISGLLATLSPALVLAETILPESCDHPVEKEAAVAMGTIRSASTAAARLVSKTNSPELADAALTAIEQIKLKVSKPNPFGKCWWDSRFDCFQVKSSAVNLSELLAEHFHQPSTEFTSTEQVVPANAQLSQVIAFEAKIISEMDFFCNSLRR